MLRDAADPEGLCGCLKSVALDVNAHGASEGTPAIINSCIRSYSGGRNITPKKPRL
jgi:hypothetical protein